MISKVEIWESQGQMQGEIWRHSTAGFWRGKGAWAKDAGALEAGASENVDSLLEPQMEQSPANPLIDPHFNKPSEIHFRFLTSRNVKK